MPSIRPLLALITLSLALPLEVSNAGGTVEFPFEYRSTFVRGEVDGDGKVTIGDAIRVLNYLFIDVVRLDCPDAADANDDGKINISDAIGILGYLFLGTNRPPEPFLEPGSDPTEDDLACERTAS